MRFNKEKWVLSKAYEQVRRKESLSRMKKVTFKVDTRFDCITWDPKVEEDIIAEMAQAMAQKVDRDMMKQLTYRTMYGG